MDQGNSDTLLLKIMRRVEHLDRMVRHLDHLDEMFPGMGFPLPKTKPAEMGFMRTVGWLYALYYETGKASVGYLIDFMKSISHSKYYDFNNHIKIIPILRASLQHNLDPSSKTDMKTEREAAKWFSAKCGTSIPDRDSQWDKSLCALLYDASNFLDECAEILRLIESDEAIDDILSDWKLRVQRYHPADLFDEIISEVAQDIGLAKIDNVELRKRSHQKWQNRLMLLSWPYDFKIEARKLIEQTLLSDDLHVLPITGKDLMKHFQMPPGPEVGRLLRIAKDIHRSIGMGKDELITALEGHISK